MVKFKVFCLHLLTLNLTSYFSIPLYQVALLNRSDVKYAKITDDNEGDIQTICTEIDRGKNELCQFVHKESFQLCMFFTIFIHIMVSSSYNENLAMFPNWSKRVQCRRLGQIDSKISKIFKDSWNSFVDIAQREGGPTKF